MRQGIIFVLSGPSGVGKGTVLNKLLDNFKDIEYSISATTRKPRRGEIDGQDYFFFSRKDFFKKIEERDFIEWAKVHNNYYGTLQSYVEKVIEKGKDIILEIDIQGARQVKEEYIDAVYIFISPPSIKELKSRLDRRNSENIYNKLLRLKNAEEELKERNKYDYEIVNEEVSKAAEKLKAIIIAERCRIR